MDAYNNNGDDDDDVYLMKIFYPNIPLYFCPGFYFFFNPHHQ